MIDTYVEFIIFLDNLYFKKYKKLIILDEIWKRRNSISEFLIYLESTGLLSSKENREWLKNYGIERKANLEIEIEKFINAKNNLALECYQLNNTIDFLSRSNREIHHKKELFYSFDLLSKWMNEYGLKVREKLDIVLKIFKMNSIALEHRTFRECELVNGTKIETFGDIKDVCRIMKLMNNGEVKKIEKKNVKEWTKEEKNTMNQVKKMDETYYRSYQKCILVSNIIINKYLIKENSFNKVDIKFLKLYLGYTDIDKSVINYFLEKLNKELNEREKKEVLKNSDKAKDPKFAEIKGEKKYLNDKEYKILKREVDFYFKKVQNQEELDLNYEQILSIARNFLAVGYGIDDAMFFAKYANIIEKEKKENTLADYVSMYEKLLFYKNMGVDIFDELNDMKECIENMMICDNKSYITWKNILEETMEQVREKLKYKDEYERQLLKK